MQARHNIPRMRYRGAARLDGIDELAPGCPEREAARLGAV